MDAAAFAAWCAGVGLGDRTQRSFLLEDLALAEAADLLGHPAAEIAAIPTDAAAAAASAVINKTADPAPGQGLMAQIGQARITRLGCPHCGGDDIRPRGQANGKPRYRCKAAYTNAFRWRPRFLAALNLDQPQHLCGIVGADEIFILESFKGKRSDLPRPARKRGLSVAQIPIMVARDRGGAIAPAAALCRDDGSAVTAFVRRAKWMRRFHGVATKTLPNHLSWRRTIEALGAAPTSAAWTKGAAGVKHYYQSTL